MSQKKRRSRLQETDSTADLLDKLIDNDGSSEQPKNYQSLNSDYTEDQVEESEKPSEPTPPPFFKFLSAKYESLDYDVIENTLFLKEERRNGYSYVVCQHLLRWIVLFFIGTCTALVAVFVNVFIEFLSGLKNKVLQSHLNSCVDDGCLHYSMLIWAGFNVGFVAIAVLAVAYGERAAGASGIPQIRSYLNGIKVPNIVRLSTLVVKVFGVSLGTAGGLAIGKEGPMVHAGAIIAAGISQGKSTSLRFDLKILKRFRNDHEKRDFVSGGAAAGISAAFGAPVGGVLFSLEEGSSFWNQALTWRTYFCSMTATFTFSLLMSWIKGHPGDLADPGLINFGAFTNLSYLGFELPLFLLMGVFGGLAGALFNHLSFRLSVFRMRYVQRPWALVLEAMLVALATTMTAFLLVYGTNECQYSSETEYPIQMWCGDGESSAMGELVMQTPEKSIGSLFHHPPGSFRPLTLGLFCIAYFILAMWSFGLCVPSGIFIPSILIGAAWGRLVAIGVNTIVSSPVDPGKYALIGAAAQVGGILRMTLSLTVMLVEATGNVTFGLPLMIVLMTAKWVGDFFNEGIFENAIRLQRIPFLPWDPPPLSSGTTAMEVMSYPVSVVRTVEQVGRIVDILRRESFNGFPVVEQLEASDGASFGSFRGLILRHQLVTLLKHKVFDGDEYSMNRRRMLIEDFQDSYPRYPSVGQIHISQQERESTIDLRPYMNPAPYTVSQHASLPRIFRLFRALGLRHVAVLDDKCQVIGMVTRKDLARYRVERHGGQISVEEIFISSS